MKVKDIIHSLEQRLPLYLQESWDNSGLQVGDVEQETSRVLLTLDVHETVVEEAIALGAGLIIAHHPLLFRGMKRIGSATYEERAVRLAIKHDIAIYAAHTNADNAPEGLNYALAQELGLQNVVPLSAIEGSLLELTTFVPESHLEVLRDALWEAGAGRLGQYDSCSYSTRGEGTFRPLGGANPYIGKRGELEQVEECRLSLVFPAGIKGQVLTTLLKVHPYEMPAYSLVELKNALPDAGMGVVGDLPQTMERSDYLVELRDYFSTEKLMYVGDRTDGVRRVAICSGAGAFLWKQARALGADLFITGEAKYNDYLDVEGLTFVTVGHFESEWIATRVFSRILSEAHPSLETIISNIDNNKIKTL